MRGTRRRLEGLVVIGPIFSSLRALAVFIIFFHYYYFGLECFYSETRRSEVEGSKVEALGRLLLDRDKAKKAGR